MASKALSTVVQFPSSSGGFRFNGKIGDIADTSNVYPFWNLRREKEERPRLMQSAEMVVATAIFKMLPVELKDAVRAKVRTLGMFSADPVAADALAILDRIA